MGGHIGYISSDKEGDLMDVCVGAIGRASNKEIDLMGGGAGLYNLPH